MTKNEQEKQPLEARLSRWLEDSGYPLEMQAAQAFRRAAFSVRQGQYYADAETGKGREIDVIASDSTGAFPGIVVDVVIECKRSPSKPWVLFTNKSTKLSLLALLASTASRTGHTFISRARRAGIIQRLAQYEFPERVGYGITQGFTNGEDVAYKATMSAVNAALWSVKSHEDRWEPVAAVGLIVFPVIVIDAPLFEYFLDGDTPTLEPISRGTLHVTLPDGSGSMHVDVVTGEASTTYAEGIAACVAAFKSATDAMEAMDQDWKERRSLDKEARRIRSPGEVP